MNRRQQKKQFKNKYGVSPQEMGKKLGELLNSVVRMVKELPETVSADNMSDEEFDSLMKQDGVTGQLRIYLLLCRQQSYSKDLQKLEEEKVPKQTKVNRSE